MSFVRSSLVAVVATALAATMLGAAPASARPAPERNGDHFPAEIDTTVPAGGSSLVTTPTLSKQAKKLTVTVTPQAGATEPEADSFDQLTHVLGS
ncbi:MAG: hypothetical protein JWO76_1574, partial [Nocardioides sp.]|nr:hypothetical protein [Nocardioides sp.]